MYLDLLGFDVWFVSKCVFWSITFLLYTSTVIMQIRYRTIFGGSFFIIYIANYFYNCVAFALSFRKIRFAPDQCDNCTLPESLLDSQTLESVEFTSYFCVQLAWTCIQYTGILLISLNRYTAVKNVNGYNAHWMSSIYYILGFVIIIPFGFTFSIVMHRAYFVYSESLGYFTMYSQLPLNYLDVSPLVEYSTFIMTGSITIVSVSVNIATIIKVIKLNLLYEKNFLHMSVILSALQLAVFITDLIIDNSPSVPLWMAEGAITLFPIASNLLIFSQPWLLLASCRTTRRKMIEMYTLIDLSEPSDRMFVVVYHSETAQQRQQRLNDSSSTVVMPI